jgi:competence protein ComEC
LKNGGGARLEGVVEAVSRFENSARIEVAVARVAELPMGDIRFRASLYADPALQMQPGQRVLLPARLKPDEPKSNPGQSDLTEYRMRRALLFTGWFDSKRLVLLSSADRWRIWLDEVRRRLAERTRSLAPTPQSAALYLTLAAGLRAELGNDLEDQFALSGLAHVLSVSGLHVAALAVLTLRLMRFLVVRTWPGARLVDAKRVAAPLSIPWIWAYVLFTGNQTPAVRSAVMATTAFAAMALWTKADTLNSLALAAIALLAFDPAGIADLSLQLSFSAVLSLILLAPAIRAALPIKSPDPGASSRSFRLQKLREAGLQTFCASAAATLVGAPLVAASFHRVSLAGLISNIVCLPLCGLLTVLAAAGAAAFVAFPPAAVPFLYAGSWASEALLWIVGWFAASPGAAISVPSFGTWSSALFALGLLVFALGSGRWRAGAALMPLGMASGLVFPWALPQAGLRCTFLSVGHGDSAVLSSRGHHALVDGGGVPNGTDTGRKYVLPFLREMAISELDLAVLSHPHPDHALGMISTLRKVRTQALWLPAGEVKGPLSLKLIEAAGSARVEEVHTSHLPLTLGEATIEILGPPSDPVLLRKVNDRSVVLRVRHGQVTLLLMGDVEEVGEELIEPGPATVVKVAHHGSATSSSPAFVAAARPKFVVFCVGRNNRFHLPDNEVEERYRSIGAECFRTDLDGAVTFESNGRDVRWKTFHPHRAVAGP